ncbi:FMN-binding protein [Sulfuritalea hydrogenivorans]|uniref:Ion-translocating oxidoreductase complex subunit G n=1 Tax=Sulfuritalea hydrogenivorans sk43H TaxID=1223802 RepID=W0SEM2_9PROT|nr:FMN-binding protein [Sulfuritalea hydrogenivorans]BAO29220.1 electron transport complex, RnfABCDGE type, G subunit RnfG [Sulfuritalea hydrogenivorans sk43H]
MSDQPASDKKVIPIAVAQPEPAPPASPTAAMIRTLGLVSAICGLIIVGAYEGTYDAVAANKKIATERAVFKVIPAAKSIAEYVALPAGGIEPRVGAGDTANAPGAVKFFAAYDAAGKLAGIAAEGGAKGYADTVRIMFGYSPDCQCVVGIGVVNMRETPGIGDKIITDKEFLANFNALDVKLKGDLSALANEVKAVKHGAKTSPWQIDAIAGATITSRAVGKAINDTAQALLPRLVPNLEKLGSKS